MSRPSNTNPPKKDDAARLTHELANLLDASLRNLGLGLNELGGDEPMEHMADAIARLRTADQGLKRMAMLIRQWMGRSDAGFEPIRQRGTLGEAVRHAVELLGPGAAQRHAVMQAHVADEADVLPAGPIYPLLINALRNSLEAIDAADRAAGQPRDLRNPHRIELAIDIEHQEVRIRVSDTGCGIEPSLVDADGQFRFGRTTKTTGYGLGMTISRDIVAALGGQMRLSTREEGGAILSVRFPVAAVQGSEASE